MSDLIKIDGLNETYKIIKQLSPDATKKIIEQILRKGAKKHLIENLEKRNPYKASKKKYYYGKSKGKKAAKERTKKVSERKK